MEDTSKFLVTVDRVLEWMKRRQRWFYSSELNDLELKRSWLTRPENGGYDERVYSVPLPLDDIRTVAIFKPDEIGDAVCALPALAELRRALPGRHLQLFCRPETRALYERTRLVDQVTPLDVSVRWRRFRRIGLEPLGDASFDLSIYLRTYPSGFKTFKKIPARVLLHPRDPRLPSRSIYQPRVSLWGETRVHQTLQLLEIVAPVTRGRYTIEDVRFPEFHWTDEDRRALEIVFGGTPPEKYLVVHPFAIYETRRYPYWPELVKRLASLGRPIVVIGGKQDPATPFGIQAQGKLSLTQTGFLLSRASGFIGNESGPAQWSGALGTRTAVLMGGHSTPVEWAPLNRSLVLRADVPCAPCHLRTCPEFGVACLKALAPDRVWDEIASFLR